MTYAHLIIRAILGTILSKSFFFGNNAATNFIESTIAPQRKANTKKIPLTHIIIVSVGVI